MALTPRPVWPLKANWINQVVEGKEWLTGLLSSTSGAEQRRALRFWPRRDFSFDVVVWDTDRFWLDNFLHATSALDYWLPIFAMGERARLNPAFPKRIYMTDPQTAGYLIGGPLILLGHRLPLNEVLEVASVSPTYVTVTTAPVNEYPERLTSYPGIQAKLAEQPKFTRHTDTTQSAPVKFQGTGGRLVPAAPALPEGPMILDGLIVNSYHQEEGRGGYFHGNSGTSEGQFVFIYAMYRAYEELIGGTPLEDQTARYYRDLAETMLDAMGVGDYEGPILRQPIPDDPDTITLLHWLFAARGDIPMQNVVYTLEAERVAGNKLRIPANWRGSEVYRVWQIYPATSQLLFESPDSPAYDIETPALRTETLIPEAGWSKGQFEATVTIPATNSLGVSNAGINRFKLVYGYSNAALIPQKFAQEAYPNWTLVEPGYAACAPDTFRWFEQAIDKAILYDTRPGKAAGWLKLRNAMRRTAIKGQNLSDLREVLQPMPGFDVIPASGAPDGMYCYSDHELAVPPVKPGLAKEWTGYDFWTRAPNGDIIGDIPVGAKAQVQIGRGFADQWRTTESYQDPDQYLYISMSTSKSPAALEDVFVYVSQTQSYDEETRWLARLQLQPNWATTPNASGVVEYFVPLSAFKQRLYPPGSELPVDGTGFAPGQIFENFGISLEMAGPYRVRIRDMRLVSGVSKAWVDANKAKAVKGSKMPFFPGAMPFAINADTRRQQFVGWNGSPFHGYQLADFWWWLKADADIQFPTLTVNDLPIPGAGGALTYPLTAKTVPGNVTKTRAALLCEQQLMFLKQAAAKWIADGGAAGPWAHTFVLNTPARKSLGNPTPHTWVYVNDDPNTRWVGYQVRIVESIALLGYLCRDDPAWADVKKLALDMAQNWLNWLRLTWTSTTAGIPTDFIDPAIGAPLTLYEEPHAPAILLRAAVWLRACRPATATWLDPLCVKMFNYVESFWNLPSSGDMGGTWSTLPLEHNWFGFWHGEIIQSYTDMLAHPSHVASGISLTTLRDRLVQTQPWLEKYGVKSSNRAPINGAPIYRDYGVLSVAPNQTGNLSREFDRLISEFDPGYGLTARNEQGDRLFERQTYTWFLKGRDNLDAFTDFLEQVKGRWKPFWTPTFMSDFKPVADAVAGDTQIVVKDTGFTLYGGARDGRQDVFIAYKDGTFDCRRIRSSVVSGETEILTLNEGLSQAIKPSTLKRISMMQLKRFDQDRIEIAHPTDSKGVATCEAVLKSAPELRQSLPAFYRVGD